MLCGYWRKIGITLTAVGSAMIAINIMAVRKREPGKIVTVS
jgi:hypothetical protein